MGEQKNLKISATVIVVSKDYKALIVQRPLNASFPGKWTVPGGKVDPADGRILANFPEFKYQVAESCAIREIKEETGIHLDYNNLTFLCTILCDSTQRLIISFYAIIEKKSDEIKIILNECKDHRWIGLEEIKEYDFIPDIGGEIEEVLNNLNR